MGLDGGTEETGAADAVFGCKFSTFLYLGGTRRKCGSWRLRCEAAQETSKKFPVMFSPVHIASEDSSYMLV